jgi:stage II sporulation protein D
MRPPRALPFRLPSRRTAAALSCAVFAVGSAVAVGAAGSAEGAAPRAAARSHTEIARFSPTGSLTVQWRGNGHGHGMSQYGARGAALQGRSMKQILAFYYPHTTLTQIRPSWIRVALTNSAAPQTTVLANVSGLRLSGVGTLPASGYKQFRLVPAGSGLTLQGRTTRNTWKVLHRNLGTRADFSSSSGWVQVLDSDGSSIRYRGKVGAVRSGSGEVTINRTRLDYYVEGTVAREVPSSWPAAAVRAQAVAARSYADAVRGSSGSSLYDICDTTSCQAYGGAAGYDSSGHLLWTDNRAAIVGNQRTVLRYQGGPVLAQYSASNGGATVDGGLPYLVARTDPYDTSASGDPYLNESERVRAAALARSYGLKSVTSIQVTKRDGYGPWGGRVVSAYVNGKKSSGAAAHIATTGDALGAAVGLWTDYLRIG